MRDTTRIIRLPLAIPALDSPVWQGPLRALAWGMCPVTLWVECFRLLPQVPRQRRIAFTHGLGVGLVSVCLVATTIGYSLAANLPQSFAAAILLLTPLAFLLSTARNCRQLADILALALGLALFPLVAMLHTGVDILISGVSAGTIAYGAHWWRQRE